MAVTHTLLCYVFLSLRIGYLNLGYMKLMRVFN